MYSIQFEENVYDERVKGDDMVGAARYTGLLFGKNSLYVGKTTFLKSEGEFERWLASGNPTDS